jgi:hypothetical protein
MDTITFRSHWRKASASSPKTDQATAEPTPPTLLPALDNSTTCIRLLTLHARASQYDPILCSISAYNIEDAPPYTAISYCWGTPKPNWQGPNITVNGIPTHVRMNLWAFLHYTGLKGWLLGFPGVYWKRHLWIDALCINQEDETEKADQVSMMGEIYSRAYSVCAWLGVQPNTDDWLDWKTLWTWRTGFIHLPSAKTTTSNDFWNRMWVVQEVKSAKRLMFASGYRYVTAEQFKTTIGQDGGGECSWVFDLAFKKHQTSLLDWIMHFHSFACADARDKIFAINNLVPQSQRIEVDYHLSFGEIYLLVLDRQFGDIRDKTFEEIRMLHTIVATFVVDLLGVPSMNSAYKYIRMPKDQVIHVGAKIESVVAYTHLYNGAVDVCSTWSSETPYDYAISYPPGPVGSEPQQTSMPSPLEGVPHLSQYEKAASLEGGGELDEAYTTIGPTVKLGLATSGIQRGDLICSISGTNRIRAVIRPFVCVPENLAYGPLQDQHPIMSPKPPLRDNDKLLFVPIVPEGKTQDTKIWLSYQVIGLALHTNDQLDSPPAPHISQSEEPKINRHALYEQFQGMPVRLYLNEEHVAALLDFAEAYDDLSLSIEPLDLDQLRPFDRQREVFVNDPWDPTGQKHLSSKWLKDPKNIIYKTVELKIAEQMEEKKRKDGEAERTLDAH